MKVVVPDPAGEEDMQAALALRETASNGKLLLKVPSLWLYEVGNTLVRRFASHALQALELLLAFGMQESVPDSRWLAQAVALTRRYGVTFYDAAYHALALSEQGMLGNRGRSLCKQNSERGRRDDACGLGEGAVASVLRCRRLANVKVSSDPAGAI